MQTYSTFFHTLKICTTIGRAAFSGLATCTQSPADTRKCRIEQQRRKRLTDSIHIALQVDAVEKDSITQVSSTRVDHRSVETHSEDRGTLS